MKYWYCSVLLLLISYLTFGQKDSHISLSKVTPDGGVAYSQITSIMEDDKGFIWFGTNNGLFSYDAISIKRYNYLQRDPTSISTNRINRLFRDNIGKLWIATENGLCAYNPMQDNFIRYEISDQFNKEIGKDIISFFQDKNNIYWFSDGIGMATFDPELRRAFYKNIDEKTNRISHATIGPDQTIWVFYADGTIYFKTEDSDNFKFYKKSIQADVSDVVFYKDFMWIAYSNKGLVSLRITDGSIIQFFDSNPNKKGVLSGCQIRSLARDDEAKIWVATDKGIVIIENDEVVRVIDKQKYNNLPHNSIWSLYKDSNNSIWIGTWLSGLCFHNKYNNSFEHYTQSTSKESLSSNIVSCFVETPNKSKVLLGTDDDDLNIYDPKTNVFSTLPITYKGKSIKRIKSVAYDKYETLWVGTYRNGVLYKQKGKKLFERLIPPFKVGLQALIVLPTDTGLWVSNFPLGAYFYNFETKEFTNYKYNSLDDTSLSNNNVNHIFEDSKNNLWFATEKGLNLLKKGTSKFIRFYNDKHKFTSISNNFINHIHEDDEGYLWLATNGEGLDKLDPNSGLTEHFSMGRGAGNEIFSILQDQNENLWLTTNNGLYKFNIPTKQIESFNSTKGIRNNKFYPTAALRSFDGDFYFGGSNGLIKYHPETIISNPVEPIATLTHLFVHSKLVVPGDKSGVLSKNIYDTSLLELNYTQNSIGFGFTTNNYINPQNNRFKYRLNGFDENWIQSAYDGQATFTNVPPGRYIFEVMASNNNGVWNEQPTRLEIQIHPPFWQTWYAYLSYLILFIGSLYFFRRQALNRQKLKMTLEMSRIQSDTEEKLHQMRLQFFTNISHEFRTPLTLIQGPVNRLLKIDSLNEVAGKQLSLIKNNTDRLLRLINQFLDFRRVDQGKLQLSPIHSDVIQFCENVFNCFEEHATHRSFKFNFITELSSLKMDFDADKLDKVLVNILSNAFKNTEDNGVVTLKIKKNNKTQIKKNWNKYVIGKEIQNDFIEICISDSGHGISADNLPKLFERFFKIENEHEMSNGTGIGLSLSMNYIEMHGGQLIVSSLKDIGTTFTIYLPVHQENTLTDESAVEMTQNSFETNFETVTSTSTQERSKKLVDNRESLILIVEDNPDLLEFLEESLSNHFRIAKAKNGKEALTSALSLSPDLIISDIMMPVMDGIELCENIKNDIRTSHIPVILLTALSAIKDRISGMESGADAYVPKPYNEEFLVAQVNNLISSRKKLRSLFASKQDVWENDIEFLDLDKKLLQKAIKTVEENISNCDFSVEDLSKKLGLSRTHLHRKLKSLTNQSATEFIRNIRLKRSVELLKSGDYLINEIGYAVGFNSHNYFTKAFKKQYGKSPSEYKKEELQFK